MRGGETQVQVSCQVSQIQVQKDGKFKFRKANSGISVRVHSQALKNWQIND